MFKVIKIELFDSFQCLMDKCPDNCCDENWIITVDDATYALYREIGIENLDDVVSAQEPHVILKNSNGKCPFITDNGLCLIHKNMGEDYLGNTCKSYPRFVSTYENDYNDLFVENIGLSCPAASDWVLGLDRVCEIKEQVYYEQPEEVGRAAIELPAERKMKEILSFVQNIESYQEGMRECYKSLNCEYTPIELKLLKSKDLLLRNISICFMFENLMLESKKDNPEYSAVLDRVVSIIKLLDEVLCEEVENGKECTDKLMSDCLYKIMRREDHRI